MFNWLDNMRAKSPGTQRLWAFGISLFVVGVIFILWLTFWFPSFLQGQSVASKNNTLNNTLQSQYVTPSQNIWGDFGSLWSSVTSQYDQLQTDMKNINLNNTVQYQATSTATTTGN